MTFAEVLPALQSGRIARTTFGPCYRLKGRFEYQASGEWIAAGDAVGNNHGTPGHDTK